MNQGFVKGELETFLNFITQSKEAIPKNIMIDSIRMNLDWARTAVSAKSQNNDKSNKTKAYQRGP